MRNEETQRRNCQRKQRFPLEVHAEVHALGRMNSANPWRRSVVPIYAYKCPVCGGWHLTRKRPTGKTAG